LFGETLPIELSAHKDVEVLLLKLDGDLLAISGEGAEPAMAANPGAVPSTNSTPRLRKITSSAAPTRYYWVKDLPALYRNWGFQVTDCFDDLFGEKGRHACIKAGPK